MTIHSVSEEERRAWKLIEVLKPCLKKKVTRKKIGEHLRTEIMYVTEYGTKSPVGLMNTIMGIMYDKL